MPTEQEYINYKDFVESLDEATPSANDKAVFNDANGPKGSVFSAIATFVHNTFAAFVNALTVKTSFASGDKIPVVNGSTSTAMAASKLLELTAQNAIAGNTAPAFDPTRTSENPYKAGESVVYDGKTYTFKVDHYGAWDAADVYIPSTISYLLSAKSEIAETILNEAFAITKNKVFSSFDERNIMVSVPADGPFVIGTDLSGYIISCIGIKFYSSGIFSIGVCKKVPSNNLPYSGSDIEIVCKINVENVGYNIIYLPTPIFIEKGQSLCVADVTDTALFYYGDYGDGSDWYAIDYVNNIYKATLHKLGIDVYGYNLSEILNKFQYLEENVRGKSEVLIDGYSASNVTAGTFATSPYVLDQSFDSDIYLKTIQINVRGAGKVSVGSVKKQDIVEGELVDYSKFNVLETFEATGTGIKEFTFTGKPKVSNDELIFIGLPSDTLTFYYGQSGYTKGFVYVNSSRYAHSPSSVNVNITAFVPLSVDSVYNGKKISILGDSISTFAGYIPEGNATYYPSGTVQNVKDTWWKKLIDALGLVLDVNNSWSGSRVTTTAGEASAGCGDRAEALGTSPDIIIVWMGINDFNNEVALGTYDGKSAIPATTTTFREAYGIMLNKILTKYQKAEVWVCTLPQCERNGSAGFPEINANGVALADFNEAILELANAFGVKVLDHNKCGLTYQNMPTFNTDQLHPNRYGHSLVANHDIRQMDNFVRVRYDIA